MIFNYYKNCIPTGISSALRKKKKKSPSIWFRTPKPGRIHKSGGTGNRGVTLSHEGYTRFMTCGHSGIVEYRYLNACDCMYWYCMLLLGEE